MNVVWFKRDLRTKDHKALSLAAKKGNVLPLYILEPALWRRPDMSERHYLFLKDCLFELNQDLAKLGQQLVVKVGNAIEILEDIHHRFSIDSLWSHQETWNGWTYNRDKDVKKWCQSRQIVWHEPTQNGVIRCLDDRDGWATRWHQQMKTAIAIEPQSLNKVNIDSDPLPSASELGMRNDNHVTLQKGGRREGLKSLNTFIYDRGEGYTKAMSSPLSAFESCSRISPHLAFGTISIKEAFRACEKRKQELRLMPKDQKGTWPSAMRSFSGRLRWHCHFIQKLEDEPRIEFENMHSAYDGLRTDKIESSDFNAWKSGRTGYPMVDACMRSLIATGWLNFRMRAMLMSFASYHLWLHWRAPALYLATLFTDYEPGIHYSQVQMQSGTTGINAIRIYNPIKQGLDHDPDGLFIRRWVPELAEIDQQHIHLPWQAKVRVADYPSPIVDEKEARKKAADSLYALRKNNLSHSEKAKKIVKKHASRRTGTSKKKNGHNKDNNNQRELPL